MNLYNEEKKIAPSHQALVNTWASEFDLDRLAAGLAHISIPEQRAEHIVEFAKAVFLDGMQHSGLLNTSLAEALPARAAPPTLEGFADGLLAPVTIVRDRHGFFNHPSLPACDEDVRLDKLLGAFGLETRLVDLESDALSVDAKEKMSEAFDFSEWMPTPPAGAGWVLLQIQETEDGAYALFARRPAKLDGSYRRRSQMTSDDQIGGLA
ncbi:hypothetical protein LJR034_008620 [Caballeronia sp. LjRoot34]|uniref:hypothetical protein n=1 Tax=Caballeronia sp. LjRoot34 TaxID=3342325 RepID=UPI003ECD3401